MHRVANKSHRGPFIRLGPVSGALVWPTNVRRGNYGSRAAESASREEC